MKGSDLLVSALENEGVEWMFGVPGEETLDIVESLRGSRIKLILTRHEQAADFMAATQGRLTGRPGVCLATLGPGALNLATGAAYALLGAMQPQAGQVSGRGHRCRDDAAGQDGASDRQRDHDSLDRARRFSLGPAGTAGARSSGTAGRRCG